MTWLRISSYLLSWLIFWLILMLIYCDRKTQCKIMLIGSRRKHCLNIPLLKANSNSPLVKGTVSPTKPGLLQSPNTDSAYKTYGVERNKEGSSGGERCLYPRVLLASGTANPQRESPFHAWYPFAFSST
jgi:hypothetical protein